LQPAAALQLLVQAWRVMHCCSDAAVTDAELTSCLLQLRKQLGGHLHHAKT
jgi:hypothetical protein